MSSRQSDRSEPLLLRWRALLGHLGLTGHYDDVFPGVDLTRIEPMLRQLDELEHRATHPERVELAAWLACAERLPDDVATDVRRLLAVLGEHDPAPEDPDAQVLSDADLAPLSSPVDEYRAYAEQLPVDGATRLEQVDALLRRDSIYRTPEMRAGREARAQLNLAREREALITTVNSAKSHRGRDPIR